MGLLENMIAGAAGYAVSEASKSHPLRDAIDERINRSKQKMSLDDLYYLYSLLSKNEQLVIKLFMAYSRNSGLIEPSPFVKHIIIMLYPLYPFEREEEVFECLQKLLLDDKVV